MEPEPPPPDPTSPSSPPATGPAAAAASEAFPAGGEGGAEGDDAWVFSAGLEPLWSLLFGDPAELEPMWSPPREFGVGVEFAAPEAEAEVDDAEGPWDGAPWRSTGVIAGEGSATCTTLLEPTPAAGFTEVSNAASDTATATSQEAVLEVMPIHSGPDSASPVPSPSCAPNLEEPAPMVIPGWEPALPLAMASSEAKLELEDGAIECTLNSVPSPSALPSSDRPDLGAEDGPKDWSSLLKVSSGSMPIIDAAAMERPGTGNNAANCSMPDITTGDGTPLRRSARIVSIKTKANAASLEKEIESSRTSKHRLAHSSISEGRQQPVSARLFEETTVASGKPVHLPDGVKPQGSQEIIAVQSSCTDVVVALPVVSKRSLKNKAVSSSPRKTRSSSKVVVNSNRVSAVSPVMNCVPAVHKASSRIPPRKRKLASEKCSPNLERVDAVLHNSGSMSANKVVHGTPVEVEAASSQPRKAKQARISSGKCSLSLKRAEKSSISICELPMVTSTLALENKLLDTHCTDSEMADSMDVFCFFVGDTLPDEQSS